ncbi:tyrosine-type recombinase/integrase [Paraburkholderia sp. LEh10]|uniref:tyrosine-type recombinase/integrase n=1 Tax=Paraburkholderia sp. LEh10 TaxID=2821353 RepID=UPI001AE1F3B4|nr:tyrosine-type recombinase/integrase [Paraburkholderia sp. LEh10]MBP0596282.1 tyrosine-type recombinase/integrase [Paraburkholderia sp. LEh10]
MMLEQIFPKGQQPYAQSSVTNVLEDFANWLVDEGYMGTALRRHLFRLKRTLEGAGDVTAESRFSPEDLAALFALPAANPGAQKLYRHTQHRFERFLSARGHLLPVSRNDRFATLLDAYRDSLVNQRGMSPSTVGNHMRTAMTFLSYAVSPEASLAELSMQSVDRFVAVSGERMNRQSLQQVVAHLRSFLLFCHVRGEIREPIGQIDTPRTYRDELPPRALPWRDVLVLLHSIDRSSMVGCRDHAILYLMAHYGLRPAEIAALQLDSIDWTQRTLLVHQRKTCSELLLPLSVQTTRILKHYLNFGRPVVRGRTDLFLRSHRPATALCPTAINEIYKRRMLASGLALQGSSAYSLRHAFAMRLLNRGVGLKAIGDLLGHRSLESTCVYLRLQMEVLREVGLPLRSATTNILLGSSS